jgi:hypothetical protein
MRPYLKNTLHTHTHTHTHTRAGGMAQGVGPGLKPNTTEKEKDLSIITRETGSSPNCQKKKLFLSLLVN